MFSIVESIHNYFDVYLCEEFIVSILAEKDVENGKLVSNSISDAIESVVKASEETSEIYS